MRGTTSKWTCAKPSASADWCEATVERALVHFALRHEALMYYRMEVGDLLSLGRRSDLVKLEAVQAGGRRGG
jgi:hypothetical protein